MFNKIYVELKGIEGEWHTQREHRSSSPFPCTLLCKKQKGSLSPQDLQSFLFLSLLLYKYHPQLRQLLGPAIT